MKSLFLLPVLTLCASGVAQKQTVGVLSYDTANSFKGYNLIYPNYQSNVYLLDQEGQVVHRWDDSSGSGPGSTVYLLGDGSIIKTESPAHNPGDFMSSEGAGGTVERRDWDNNLMWTFTLNDSFNRLHHDVEPMPGGNILMLCWERKTAQEAIEKGRDPAYLANGEIWSEKIIEVQQIGTNGYKIIWEWKLWDHLVQDFDSTKPGYGNPADYPQKIDINYAGSGSQMNWVALNAISYNKGLDQIVVSSAEFSEIWIIDHSTTTQEAASEFGGAGLKGGGLLLRWGNPLAYGVGTSADQRLFAPNNAQWLGKYWSDKNFGKIMVFNNQAGSDYSTVNIIFPTIDTYQWEYQKIPNTDIYAPIQFDWIYKRPDSASMYSSSLSSAQLLGNGNLLVCTAENGYSFEATPAGDIVWEYKTPLKEGKRAKQGEVLDLYTNTTPQITRYPVSASVFTGRDMSQKGFLELPADSIITGLEDHSNQWGINVFPNPANSVLQITSQTAGITSVAIYTYTGRILYEYKYNGDINISLDVSKLPTGLYLVSVNQGQILSRVEIRGLSNP